MSEAVSPAFSPEVDEAAVGELRAVVQTAGSVLFLPTEPFDRLIHPPPQQTRSSCGGDRTTTEREGAVPAVRTSPPCRNPRPGTGVRAAIQ